ncbi:MAG: SAM-dependent methyltransferase [Anaeromyxobacter sp. RBG_16_69_14]|nr:MAG: SAM-dependent methyltransferase [Anaeromyxobacter sp. RBG_16_69_14]
MSEFDEKAKDWDSDPQKVDRARRVVEAILGQVCATGRMHVFEYGCGTGLLGFALKPHVAHVTLADSSQAMLAVLRQKIEASGVRSMTPVRLDLSSDPLPESRYDLVCTLMTLHHIPDTDGILRDLSALLRPTGSLCISDLDAEDGSFHGGRSDVHKGFDRADLAASMERAGLRNVRFSTVCEIAKPAGAGTRSFPVFLAVGEKG